MDFLEDRPYRKPLSAVETPSKAERVYLFTSGKFFLERDKDMAPVGTTPSQKVVDQVKNLSGAKLIYIGPEYHHLVVPLEDHGFEVIKDNEESVVATVAFLRGRLQELGIRFKPTRNPREISTLNLSNFAVGPLTMVKEDDYQILNITPDKEKTFDDFAAQRKANAWP